MPAEDRPLDDTPRTTAQLPSLPQRDYAIAATAWVDAPTEVLALDPPARYLRRIGTWVLWRSGPPNHAHATYWAARADDLTQQLTFALEPDGTGIGFGPTGMRHDRFRTWKEDLLAHS